MTMNEIRMTAFEFTLNGQMQECWEHIEELVLWLTTHNAD